MAKAVRIRLLGDRRLKRAFKAIARKAPECTANALNETAIEVHNIAKQLCPVNKKKNVGGRLRSSIRFTVAQPSDGARMNASVFTNVHYAAFVEFGTRKMKAQPYLRPAWREQRPHLIKRLKACGPEFARAARKVGL